MKSLFLALSLLCSLTLSAQRIFRARVVDAETGEKMPLARVIISDRNYTLSNNEGNFSINARGSDVIRISYVGYDTVVVKAADLPEKVEMRPMTRDLGEVKVIPVEHILLCLAKALNAENRENANAKCNYFYRITNSSPEQTAVIEAFTTAYSTININSARILNGRTFCPVPIREFYDELPSFFPLFQHDIFELGPEIPPSCRSPLAADLNLPIPEWARKGDDLGGRELSCHVLKTPTGETLYQITIVVDAVASAKAGEEHLRLSAERALSGTIYVQEEKHDYRLLSFDGQLTGIRLSNVRGEVHPVDIRMHIDFQHNGRFTEPVTVYGVMSYDEYVSRMLAFKVNVPDLYLMWGPKADIGILDAISQTQYRPELWTQDIILRTEEEEEIVQKMLDGKE